MTALFISHSSKDKAWALQVHEALSRQGYQSLFQDSHPDDGIHAGAKWEQMLWQQLRQSRGLVVLCTAHWLTSPWCVAEAMTPLLPGSSAGGTGRPVGRCRFYAPPNDYPVHDALRSRLALRQGSAASMHGTQPADRREI